MATKPLQAASTNPQQTVRERSLGRPADRDQPTPESHRRSNTTHRSRTNRAASRKSALTGRCTRAGYSSGGSSPSRSLRSCAWFAPLVLF